MTPGPLSPQSLPRCSAIRARFGRRFSLLRPPRSRLHPNATLPGVIHRRSSSQLRAPKPIVGGPFRWPHWSLSWRASHGSPPHPMGQIAPPPYPAGIIGVLACVVARWALLRFGIGRSCRSKTAECKAVSSPGHEARAERGGEPGTSYRRGRSNLPQVYGDWPVQGHSPTTVRHREYSTLCNPACAPAYPRIDPPIHRIPKYPHGQSFKY